MKNICANYFSKSLLIISVLFCSIYSNGQNYANKNYYLIDSLDLDKLSNYDKKIIDSSLTIYHTATQDTTKIKAISNIVEESWDDQVWHKYNQWVYEYVENKLSENSRGNDILRKRWLVFKGEALNNIGYIYHSKADYDLALEYYFKSIELIDGIDDPEGLAVTMLNIGAIYLKQGNNSKALEYYFKSLKINEEIGSKHGIAESLNNIGYLYSEQDDFTTALEYYKRSLKISKEIDKPSTTAVTLSNIGDIFLEQNNFSKALEYFNESLRIQEIISDKQSMAATLHSIGKTYKRKDEILLALEFYHRSLKLSQAIGFKIGVVISYNSIGKIYLTQGNTLKAITYANTSMQIAQEIGYARAILGAAEILKEANKKQGNWKKASQMQELFHLMRDSLRNVETEKNSIRKNLNYKYEKQILADSLVYVQRQELKQIAHQTELDKEENKREVLYIGLIFLLILGGIGIRGYRRKQKINTLLKKQNEEKTAMLKEIHHRVKNNLQVVNSLLKLQSREIEDEHVVDMFKEAQNRVLSMALLHEKMYRSDDLQHINIQDHITLLVEDLVKSYSVGTKIKSEIKINEIDIGIRTLVPLGLIINEILTNALKHAFKERNEGKILVQLKRMENESCELIIGDDGVGKDEALQSTGLGNKLIGIFTKQLKGTMERLKQPGTVFKIQFQKID